MTFFDVQKILFEDGWYLVSVNGSHYQYKHPTKKGKVIVAKHNKPKDLKPQTVKLIFKQAQIEFRKGR